LVGVWRHLVLVLLTEMRAGSNARHDPLAAVTRRLVASRRGFATALIDTNRLLSGAQNGSTRPSDGGSSNPLSSLAGQGYSYVLLAPNATTADLQLISESGGRGWEPVWYARDARGQVSVSAAKSVALPRSQPPTSPSQHRYIPLLVCAIVAAMALAALFFAVLVSR
jgi:hypothetical protein